MTDESFLLRQIHPSFVQNGHVTSQAFRPTPKDEKLLSVYDGELIEPSETFHHYTEILKHNSEGCMAVTQRECTDLDLDVRSDPEPFPEHAVIDFTDFTDSHIKTVSKRLRECAVERDWVFHA